MNDEAQVWAVSDGSSWNQWGRSLFFKKEGQKLPLDKRRASIALGVVFTALTVLSLMDETPAIHTSPTRGVDAPVSLSDTQLVHVPEVIQTAFEPRHQASDVNRRRRRLTAPQIVARPRDLGAIPPGSMMKAVLASGASNGVVRAEAKEAVRANGEILIEQGAVLLGTGSSSEERLYLKFNHVVFRDGTFGTVEAHACDASDRIVGLKGSKIGNKALNVAGSIGLGFVGGLTEGLQDTQGQGGVAIKPPSLKNALLNATATTALQQSGNLMAELRDRGPIIEVPAGTEICVIFGVGR